MMGTTTATAAVISWCRCAAAHEPRAPRHLRALLHHTLSHQPLEPRTPQVQLLDGQRVVMPVAVLQQLQRMDQNEAMEMLMCAGAATAPFRSPS